MVQAIVYVVILLVTLALAKMSASVMTYREETFISDTLPPQTETCSNFTTGMGFLNGHYEFTTPNYEEANYPSQSSCIRVIRADQKDRLISLDFRGEFHIEESSKCSADYLEIRDGPYGYSPLLGNKNGANSNGRYCGAKPPAVQLTSSGQYLWLRFRSDEHIEHKGFRAVYQFIPAPKTVSVKKECLMELQMSVGSQEVVLARQLKARFPQNYLSEPTTPVDCSIDVSSPEGTQIMVSIEILQVRRDDLCKQQALYFYDGFTVDLKRDFTLCRTLEPKTWTHLTSTRRAVIHVTSKDTYLMPKFLVVFTVVRMGTCQAGSEFDCGSERCINARLECNDHINCPNGRDEVPCANMATHSHETSADSDDKKTDAEKSSVERRVQQVPYHPIILGAIGIIFITLTIACFTATIRQRLRERRAKSLTATDGANTDATQAATARLTFNSRDFSASQALTPNAAQLSPTQTVLLGSHGNYPIHNGYHHQYNGTELHNFRLQSSLVDPGKFLDPRGCGNSGDRRVAGVPASPLVTAFLPEGPAASGTRLTPDHESADSSGACSGGQVQRKSKRIRRQF